MFLNKKRAAAFHLLALCCLVYASDKKIELDDIEQDNLKSERANEDNKGAYLETPNVNAEQAVDYESPESDAYNKKQYAVEEPNPSAPSLLLYPSRVYHQAGIKYVEVKRGQGQSEKYDLNNQATSSAQNGEQQSYRYIPRLAMHLVYVPQAATSPGNNIVMYTNQYQQKVPGIVYQPHPQPTYVQVQQQHTNNIETEEDDQQQTEEVHSPNAGYLPPAAEDSAAHVQPQTEQYVITPQYQEQQVQYVENEGKSQHYQTYAPPQQQYVLANQMPQEQVYYKTEYRYASPSSSYKSAAPQYESGHNRVTQIAPPAIAFSIPTTGQTGDTPRVLSQYAHGVSRPVYSHISGHLVQDQYKSHDGRGGLMHEQYNIPQQVTGNYINEPYRPIYSSHYVRKPTSLLDSYIPSSLQIEYLKRGLSKEPLATYDLIANSRRYRYERGFLPNQMYTTPTGGVMFGKYKRAVKTAKS